MSSLRASVSHPAAAELRRWTLDEFRGIGGTPSRPSAPTVVRLMRQDDRLVLDVADHDLAASPQPADRPLGKGGLGLRLTQTFAAEVGWYTTDETKHVWASFPG
jgi:hypothetical protein